MAVEFIGLPDYSDLFRGGVIKISGGLIEIDPGTGVTRFNPTMTVENAAKLAASWIYAAMDNGLTGAIDDPLWVNSVTFCDDKTVHTPCLVFVDDQIYVNTPPFKGRHDFWTFFSNYWFLCVQRSRKKALGDKASPMEKRQIASVEKQITDLPGVGQ